MELSTCKLQRAQDRNIPIRSMYGILTYNWLYFTVNAGKYAMHGSYGRYKEH